MEVILEINEIFDGVITLATAHVESEGNRVQSLCFSTANGGSIITIEKSWIYNITSMKESTQAIIDYLKNCGVQIIQIRLVDDTEKVFSFTITDLLAALQLLSTTGSNELIC